MIVRIDLSGLRESRWYEFVIRFILGGLMTVAAGAIATFYGPEVGGLFLAFPAIFLASTTLIEKHERERKEEAGVQGVRRGKEAAALDSAGAALGSIGLAAFGLVIWLMMPIAQWVSLIIASAAWLCVSLLLWSARRVRIFSQ
jgi:Protein of unknown function (DUF3147)